MPSMQKSLLAMPFPRQEVVVRHTFIEAADTGAEDLPFPRTLSGPTVLQTGPAPGASGTSGACQPEEQSDGHDSPDGESAPRPGGRGGRRAPRPMHESSAVKTFGNVGTNDDPGSGRPPVTGTGSTPFPTYAPTLLQARRGPGSGGRDSAYGCAAPAQPARGAAGVQTTVFVCNIPCFYSRARILSLLDAKGFRGLYDFVYLPVDFRTNNALGYAFVNMVEHSHAQRAWDALDGFSAWVPPCRKRCRVRWSEPLQGFHEHVERYRNSPVMHSSVPDSHKPAVFSGGARAPFPAPTKRVPAPRVR